MVHHIELSFKTTQSNLQHNKIACLQTFYSILKRRKNYDTTNLYNQIEIYPKTRQANSQTLKFRVMWRKFLQYRVVQVIKCVNTNSQYDNQRNTEHHTEKTPIDDSVVGWCVPSALIHVHAGHLPFCHHPLHVVEPLAELLHRVFRRFLNPTRLGNPEPTKLLRTFLHGLLSIGARNPGTASKREWMDAAKTTLIIVAMRPAHWGVEILTESSSLPSAVACFIRIQRALLK